MLYTTDEDFNIARFDFEKSFSQMSENFREHKLN